MIATTFTTLDKLEECEQHDALQSVSSESKLYERERHDDIEERSRLNGEEFQELFKAKKNGKKDETCYSIFQDAMKLVLFWGQCWGLNPVMGILDQNPSNVRFEKDSYRLWYSAFTWLCQATLTVCSLISLFSTSTNITAMAYFSFFFSTSTITLLSIYTASKWPNIAQEVAASNLHVNPNIKRKCIVVFVVFVLMAVVEHTLSWIASVAFITDCYNLRGDIYEEYIKLTYGFIFKFGVPYHITLGIFLQFLTFVCTINWNYSDLFIISISIYLTSVLQEISKKISWASRKSVPPASWRSVREAYTRATCLVRTFDNAINKVIFVSFATSLFFICLQLFNVLSNGLKGRKNENCPNFPSGLFQGYEHSIYYLVSLLAVLGRSLSLALFAADIDATSKTLVSALYEVPMAQYSDEVQRFIDQVHGDIVALSGYDFFYVTRDLVLTVAGTIVTYELVLLQFKGENMITATDDEVTFSNQNVTL